MPIEYDPRKAAANLRKHSITFDEAGVSAEVEQFPPDDRRAEATGVGQRHMQAHAREQGPICDEHHGVLTKSLSRLLQ
jgi:uncharacterized DUF497 family protein